MPQTQLYDPSSGGYNVLNPPPSFLSTTLKVTDRCDLRCTMCAAYGTRLLDDLSPDSALAIGERLIGGGISKVNITGGEPLLYRGLPDLLRRFHEAGLYVGLSSNLFSLSRRGSRYSPTEVSGYIHNVKTSVLGPRAIHNEVTQNGSSYDATFQSIRDFAVMGVPVFVQTAVLPGNHEHLEDIARACEDNGVKRLSLYTLIEQGKASSPTPQEVVRIDAVRRAHEMLLEMKEAERWDMNIVVIEWALNGGYILIDQEGHVRANAKCPPDNFVVVGNLLEDSVQEVWERFPFKEQHQDFYRAH